MAGTGNARKKAVTTYLAEDMHREFVDVVQARYGLSDAATLQQLIRAEIQRILGHNTKEQALTGLAQQLQNVRAQLDKQERLLHVLLLLVWFGKDHPDQAVKITAEDMEQLNRKLQEYL